MITDLRPEAEGGRPILWGYFEVFLRGFKREEFAGELREGKGFFKLKEESGDGFGFAVEFLREGAGGGGPKAGSPKALTSFGRAKKSFNQSQDLSVKVCGFLRGAGESGGRGRGRVTQGRAGGGGKRQVSPPPLLREIFGD